MPKTQSRRQVFCSGIEDGKRVQGRGRDAQHSLAACSTEHAQKHSRLAGGGTARRARHAQRAQRSLLASGLADLVQHSLLALHAHALLLGALADGGGEVADVWLSAGKGTHPKAGGVRSEARWALTPCFSVPCRTLFVLHWATGPQPATSNPGTLLLQGARLSLPDRTAHSEHAFMPHALAAWPCILHSAQPQPAQPRSALLSGSLPSQPRSG